MFEKLTLKEKYNILIQVAIVGSFIGIGFLVNHALRISGLYMDDLYMWSTYGEQSFWNMSFLLDQRDFDQCIGLWPGLNWGLFAITLHGLSQSIFSLQQQQHILFISLQKKLVKCLGLLMEWA